MTNSFPRRSTQIFVPTWKTAVVATTVGVPPPRLPEALMFRSDMILVLDYGWTSSTLYRDYFFGKTDRRLLPPLPEINPTFSPSANNAVAGCVCESDTRVHVRFSGMRRANDDGNSGGRLRFCIRIYVLILTYV